MSDVEQLSKCPKCSWAINLNANDLRKFNCINPDCDYRGEIIRIIRKPTPQAKPVDGELETYLTDTISRFTNAPGIQELSAVIARYFSTHLQAAEKAYGGCHNCYGKGYATANEFASGRGAKWRISNMRFCICERGRQLEEKLNERVQAAVRGTRVGERKKFKKLWDKLGIHFGASAGSAIGATVTNDFGESFDFQLDRDAVKELLQQLKQEGE